MTFAGVCFLMLQFLAPVLSRSRAARDVATEVAHVVDQKHPVFESPEMDAAVLLVMAYRESTFRPDAIGDGGFAHCAYQLHGAPARVVWDLRACTTLAYERLRASAVACPDNPLAVYASGSCTNRGGLRVSHYRMAEALRIKDAALTGQEEDATR